MADVSDADRLRALMALMREYGVTKLVTPDGYALERPPLSPLEAAVGVGSTSAASSKDGDDEDEEIEREANVEKDLRADWDRYWQRATRSSGAPAPAFPGPDKASAFLSRAHA